MNKNYYFEKLYIWVENNGLLILFIWIILIIFLSIFMSEHNSKKN